MNQLAKTKQNSKPMTYLLLFYLVLIVSILFINSGCTNETKHKVEDFYNVNQEISLPEKTGKDFAPQLDYEKIVDSISNVKKEDNPKNYHEFSQSVKDIHEEVLTYLAKTLNMSENDQKAVLKQYEKYHETFARDYYTQLAEQKQFPTAGKTQTAITYDSIINAQNFTNLLSSNICSLSGFILTLVTTKDLNSSPIGMFLGQSCQTILNILLKPIAMKIKRFAIIKDYTISKTTLKNHIRNMITELGTAKDSYATDFDEQYKVELIFGLHSEANLCVHARSRIKAGFKLDRYFQLEFNHSTKEILMTLPEPEILSNETDCQIVDMENGILAKIGEQQLNEVQYKVKRWGQETAIKSGILDDAKRNAGTILETIFQPIILATDPEYKIALQYKALPGQNNKIRSITEAIQEESL